MSDSQHAGLPQKGHRGLIILALLMLVGSAGLVFWKLQSKSEPEVVEEVTTAAPAPEPAAPILDHAPPPPPEEEEVKEPAKPAVAGTDAPKPTGPVGCNSPCNGSASGQLQSALAGRGSLSRSCYNTALMRDPSLTGKMTMSMRISPTGAVCSVNASSDTLGDPATTACVAQKFRGANFPAPTGGCVDVAVPLNFTKQ